MRYKFDKNKFKMSRRLIGSASATVPCFNQIEKVLQTVITGGNVFVFLILNVFFLTVNCLGVGEK